MSMRRLGEVTGVEAVVANDVVVVGSMISSRSVGQGVKVGEGSGVTTMLVTSDETPGVVVLLVGTKTVVLLVDIKVRVSVGVSTVDCDGMTTAVVGVSTVEVSSGINRVVFGGTTMAVRVSVKEDSACGMTGVDTEETTTTTTVDSVPVKAGSPGVVTGADTEVLTLLSTPGVKAVAVDPGGRTATVGIVPVTGSPGVSLGIKTEIVAVPSSGRVGSGETMEGVAFDGTPGIVSVSDGSSGMMTLRL
jgi:hypothetical protein